MPAPVGAEVGLYYDTDADVNEDDFLMTPTGRTYQIVSVRVQARGEYAGVRKHLRVIVVDIGTVSRFAKVHPLHWYKR